jgi:PTS system cellobiose-specific IIA component
MALDIEKIAFTVILHAGNAKAEAYKALDEAKQGNFDNIDKYLKNAKDELNEVHNIQTELLTAEANGDNIDLPIILVHAQDHLMTAISEINLVEELIDCFKEIRRLGEIVNNSTNN